MDGWMIDGVHFRVGKSKHMGGREGQMMMDDG